MGVGSAAGRNQLKPWTGRARIIDSWLFVPDRFLFWAWNVVRRGMQISQHLRIDAILSTSPAQSCHLAAKRLSRRLCVPWFADFRDPWASNVYFLYPTRIHRWLNYQLEATVINSAYRVITVSARLRQQFIDRHQVTFPDQLIAITNGFDPEDFVGLSPLPSEKRNKIRIVHNGRFFYAGKNPMPFLKALKLMQGTTAYEAIEVEFIGLHSSKLDSAIRTMGLSEVIKTSEHQPHRESLRYLLGADIQLLVLPNRGLVTYAAKVFEYLATGKPVLAITDPDGDNAHLLRRAKIGRVVNPDRPEEIAAAIRQLVEDFQSDRLLEPDWAYVNQFTWHKLTAMLAEQLDATLRNQSIIES
jgi:glycosyltransferase involved in cell wall biosynthesis